MTPRCISDYRPGDELLHGSPSFEPDSEYDDRMESITAARNALLEAEQALDDTRGPQLGLCDQHMADAMNALVPVMSAPATPCPYRGDCPTPEECGERKGCVLRPPLILRSLSDWRAAPFPYPLRADTKPRAVWPRGIDTECFFDHCDDQAACNAACLCRRYNAVFHLPIREVAA